MNFLEIAKKRYACRQYSSKSVEAEKLNLILEAGRIAPTGGNCQPQKILVLQESESLNKLAKGANIYGAPVAILVCCDKTKVWTRPFDGKQLSDIDASIITDHMMLQATELGLDSVWVCYFKPDIIKAEFEIPEHLDVVNILAIGYGAGKKESSERHMATRLPIEQTVCFEKLN